MNSTNDHSTTDKKLLSEQPCNSITRTHRFRRIVYTALLLVAISLFVISPFSAAILVIPNATSKADFLFLANAGCGQCYPIAIEWLRSANYEGILIPQQEHKRLVQIEVVPPSEELARQKLIREGVPPELIDVVGNPCRNQFDVIRALDKWLADHPNKRVRLICDSFSSRRWSLIVHNVIDGARRAQVDIEGIADPRFNERNWWRRRMGIKEFCFGVFQQEYLRWLGEDRLPDIDWSADRYEAASLERRR